MSRPNFNSNFNSNSNLNQGNTYKNSNVILPLKTGNTWIYNFLTNFGPQYTETISISETKVISGINIYRQDSSTGVYNYYRNHKDGLYFYGEGDTVTKSESIIPSSCLYIKYPCSIGNSWTVYDGGTFTVLSTSKAIKVEAGTFNCIRYYYMLENEIEITEHYEYWAPNIGMVQQDIYHNGKSTVSIQLASFSL